MTKKIHDLTLPSCGMVLLSERARRESIVSILSLRVAMFVIKTI
jgi:hypothetical protein